MKFILNLIKELRNDLLLFLENLGIKEDKVLKKNEPSIKGAKNDEIHLFVHKPFEQMARDGYVSDARTIYPNMYVQYRQQKSKSEISSSTFADFCERAKLSGFNCIDIAQEEWNSLVDALYDCLVERNTENDLDYLLRIIYSNLIMVIHGDVIRELNGNFCRTITFKNLLDSIERILYIVSQYNSFFDFTPLEINMIKKNIIRYHTKYSNIVYFESNSKPINTFLTNGRQYEKCKVYRFEDLSQRKRKNTI